MLSVKVGALNLTGTTFCLNGAFGNSSSETATSHTPCLPRRCKQGPKSTPDLGCEKPEQSNSHLRSVVASALQVAVEPHETLFECGDSSESGIYIVVEGRWIIEQETQLTHRYTHIHTYSIRKSSITRHMCCRHAHRTQFMVT